MEYTVVIRTLGRAGEKYQRMLDSLKTQTILPKEIIIYIAEGYEIPKETIGIEQYVYVKKGMVAQRALPYNEVKTEYMLFLDDDVYLPPNGVGCLYDALIEHNANVISPDVFNNAERSLLSSIIMTISGRMVARRNDGKWGYKVMRNSGYSYNNNPCQSVYRSQTNAGPCFFCSKEDFLSINFQDELWMDNLTYALGDDQVMFYKMHISGLKVLTIYDSGIVHLDAGSTMLTMDKKRAMIYSDFWFKTVFWHRFIYKPERNCVVRCYDFICLAYALLFTFFISLIKFEFDILGIKWNAIKNAIAFLKSDTYRNLPLIVKNIK